jgi:hypothetical protein
VVRDRPLRLNLNRQLSFGDADAQRVAGLDLLRIAYDGTRLVLHDGVATVESGLR